MSLSVIIPVYNEAQTCEEAINQVKNTSNVSQIIVIDDGSDDESNKILKKIDKIDLIEHKNNIGKGAAIKESLSFVINKHILIHDADLEINYSDISSYISNWIPSNKIILGTRLYTFSKKFSINFIGNKFLTILFNIMYGTSHTDIACCTKIIPTDIMRNLDLQSDDFSIETEIMAKLSKLNLDFVEFDLSYTKRNIKQGKKLRFIDGLKAIKACFHFN